MTTTLERRARPDQAIPAGTRPLAGTGTLIRFMLRRDRIRIPVWIGAISLLSAAAAANLPDLFATAEDRQNRADLNASPSVRVLGGPGYGLEDYTFGAMMSNEFLGRLAIATAVMSILLMVRHTRTEEETGRAELVRSAVVGRHAHTTAALAVVGGASVALGLLTALGLGAIGVETITWGGSLLYGAALASIGVVFAAVTAVTAQLTGYARGAGGLAGAAFGVSFLLRGAGDAAQVEGGALSWLSPIGWAHQTRAYVDDRWWPLLLSVALATVLVALAFWLSTRRDLGAGLRPPRPGPAEASAGLASPLGLAWRQHRTSIRWWSAALLLVGLFYGSIATEFESFVEEFSWIAEFGGDTVIESMLAALVQMLAVTVTIFAALAVLRPRSEETTGRAEPVLAAAASRTRWAGSHVTVMLAGSLVILAVAGLGVGLTAAAALDDAGMVPQLLGAAVAYAPAVWLTAGIGVVLFGWAPRFSGLVWLVVAYAGVVGLLAAPLGLSDPLTRVSPFTHVPMLPAQELDWVPVLVLTGIAAALVVVGLVGFGRRDLETK